MNNNEFDFEIKKYFKTDSYIPESTKAKISETIEKNRNIIFEDKNSFKRTKFISIFSSLCAVLFLSVNVYAYSNNLPNLFSLLIDSLNINSEVYDNEKIVVDENINRKITLNDYVYNDKVLIVNFIYKADDSIYQNLSITEDIFPLLAIYEGRTQEEKTEVGEVGCVPSYTITSKSSYIGNNEYAITKIYNMNELFIKDNKINLTIIDVLGPNYENSINEKFVLNVDNSKKTNFKTYDLDSNIIDLNLNKINKDLDLWEYSKPQFEILSIVECKLLTLLEISSNFDLGILEEQFEDGTATYSSPTYSFEITDENGKILNSKESQMLALNLDSKLEFLIIDSLENSNVLNIKVYEENTNTLIAKKQITINK